MAPMWSIPIFREPREAFSQTGTSRAIAASFGPGSARGSFRGGPTFTVGVATSAGNEDADEEAIADGEEPSAPSADAL
jgi:hypothetical protein